MPELRPAPLTDLLRRAYYEPKTQGTLFDLPLREFYRPDLSLDTSVKFHGLPAATPLGPAAGPHDQLAQNVALAWLGGSRIIELKTVQIMDELVINRPCIDVTNVGFNIEWSQELQEPGEFLNTLKVDLATAEVYAFTPKGRVIELARGATPVDFAYAVHTEVGHQCVGAKINGQMVTLRHEIANGDVVEILTQKGHTPSRDWLSFAKSSHARSKIRHWINLYEREEATEMGKRLMEKESRAFGKALKKIPEEDLQKVAADYGLSKVDDLFAAVGFGKYSARQVLSKVLGEGAKPTEAEPDDKPTIVKTVKRMLGMGEAPLIVKGHDDLLVFRAKCCNPIPGDDIVGYITRGRGVAVHNKLCPNVQNLLYQTERRIAVEWGGETAATFPIQLMIRAKDRAGLLAEITAVISGAGSNIRNLESKPDRANARIDASLEIVDRRQFETILANIRKISGVLGVERVYQASSPGD